MKAAVSLRLRPSRTEFLVFFPFSNDAVRNALLAAGILYDASARGYLLPADPALVAPVQAACQRLGLTLAVPPTPALAVPLPPPTPHEALLSRYLPARSRHRHPHHPGFTGARQYQNHRNLHARGPAQTPRFPPRRYGPLTSGPFANLRLPIQISLTQLLVFSQTFVYRSKSACKAK